jgi:beta-lactamase class D
MEVVVTKGFVARHVAGLSLVVGLIQFIFAVPCRAQTAAVQDRPDFKAYFDSAGVEGTIVVLDLRRDQSFIYNRQRAETGFLPASTYKILNSLIGLETGVVRDADNQIFKWDGVHRDMPHWNEDQTLRSAIKYSVVPVYQQIARQIGAERMLHYVQAAGYGNQDIGGATIDEFWLRGNLRISAVQQVQFLRRLHDGDLPFSKRSMEIVRDITVVEKTDAYTMHAKTGWGTSVTPQIGWYVGWVDRGDESYIFATNIEIKNENQLPARLSISRQVLHQLGII